MRARFAGYAALFGRRDAGGDIIRPGAFTTTLADLAARDEPLPLLWQHQPDLVIGRIEQIGEDKRGLRVIAVLNRPSGRAAVALRRKDVTGLSFGYRARDYLRDARGRVLTAVDLFEISLVSHPMQHGARVHLFA